MIILSMFFYIIADLTVSGSCFVQDEKYYDNVIAKMFAINIERCQRVCWDNDYCQFWTFYGEGLVEPNCWIHDINASGKHQIYPYAYRGPRNCPNYGE